jgi:hypothetical protein
MVSVYKDLVCTTCGDYKLGKLYTATPKQLVHMQYASLFLVPPLPRTRYIVAHLASLFVIVTAGSSIL